MAAVTKPVCVITTVNPPTKTVELLSNRLHVVVVGDTKTPVDWSYPGVEFISGNPEDPRYDPLFREPARHYARKNLGYLRAMRIGAAFIYDTDDDNFPNAAWNIRQPTCASNVAKAGDTTTWWNVYRDFHSAHVWPRGFSLAHLATATTAPTVSDVRYSPVQQGMADGEPDVDAIWRLTAQPKDAENFKFSFANSVSLNRNVWCPFNSQTTWWWPVAYPLMYLPVNVPFRMTDIWRSFIAQRCLWETGYHVTFHSPSEVQQDRNAHNLLHDFKDEIPGYLNNAAIVDVLAALKLRTGQDYQTVGENMIACYEALVAASLLPSCELPLVNAWISEVNSILPWWSRP